MASRGSRYRRSSVGRMELIEESAHMPAAASRQVKYFEAPPNARSGDHPAAAAAAGVGPRPSQSSDSLELKRSRSFTTDSTRSRVCSMPAYPEHVGHALLGKWWNSTVQKEVVVLPARSEWQWN